MLAPVKNLKHTHLEHNNWLESATEVPSKNCTYQN